MNEWDDLGDEDDFDADDDRISKSQRKRESHALQDIGEALVELSPKDLATIPMPDILAEAVGAARSIGKHRGKHGALKRQRQFIGKVMRNIDAEPVVAAYEALLDRDRVANVRFHQLEHWRDRLLAEGDDAIEELLEEYPGADRQRLRLLLRTAQREQEQGKAPSAARNLFKYLRELAQNA
ncbi:MAG: DUF615 domain-containing protein [Chromatiales bacterium]|nr:DUF615 domain-containing protein [Gammaproteobacteria bacterium]MCP5353076.1 DUF615 domain-containing protein [Chromatiales bacterium]